jgi:chromosome segregation ATPase
MCSPSFAGRWADAVRSQEALLARLAELKRPIEFIEFLSGYVGGSWTQVADEYRGLHAAMEELQGKIGALQAERAAWRAAQRLAVTRRLQAERAKGEHFRAAIFEREPSEADQAERTRLTQAVREAIAEIRDLRHKIEDSERRQRALVQDPSLLETHRRRQQIELEVELKRLKLIRHAITSSKGLQNADLRPSAWWMRLVSPDGLWFRQTVETAECYLEPLV